MNANSGFEVTGHSFNDGELLTKVAEWIIIKYLFEIVIWQVDLLYQKVVIAIACKNLSKYIHRGF